MVKVTPGSQDSDSNKARGITSTTINGTVAYYKSIASNPDGDLRARDTYQKDVTDVFTKATKIYKDWPDCVKDHFERGYVDIVHGTSMDAKTSKRLTGYNAAMQLLINGLKTPNQEYFKPDCFCLSPIDILGNPLSVNSHLYISQPSPAHYVYNEAHRLINYDSCYQLRRNPFKSSSTIDKTRGSPVVLRTDFCRTLDSTEYGYIDKLSEIQQPCQPWDLSLKPVDNAYPYEIDITQKPYWIWKDLGRINCKDVTDDYIRFMDNGVPIKFIDDDIGSIPIFGQSATFVDPTMPDQLCGVGKLTLYFLWTAYGFVIDALGTNGPPLWDICFAGEPVVRIGSGDGMTTEAGAKIYPNTAANYKVKSYTWQDNFKPIPEGKKYYHRPLGKITEYVPSLVECGDTCDCNIMDPDGCGHVKGNRCPPDLAYNWITYKFYLGETIPTPWRETPPEIMIQLKNICYDDRGFQCWYPWGCADVRVGMDGVADQLWTPGYKTFYFEYPKMRYCSTFNGTGTEMNYMEIRLSTTSIWSCCVRTQLGDPRDKEPCGSNQYPCLWILDKTKDPGE